MKSSAIILLIITATITQSFGYSGGSGTPEDPYQIATAEDLILLGGTPEDYDKHFVMTADIDLDPNLPGRKVFDRAVIAPDEDPTRAHHQGPPFTGHFDGNGHRISHLVITGRDFLGLFGFLHDGAMISNLGLRAVTIDGTGMYVGGLVGFSFWSRIATSYSMGTVRGRTLVGGLVGSNDYSNVTATYSKCLVGGNRYVGGLIGQCSNGTITQSYSTGMVNGNSDIGGLLGGQYESAVVLHCVWDKEASGLSRNVGGVGLSTTEMMDPNALALNGFADNSHWVLDRGIDYPRLSWEGTAGEIISHVGISWMDGLGTEVEPYQIGTVDKLMRFRKASVLWDKHLVLMADIDLAPNLPGRNVFDVAVIPQFFGVFNGNGHTISNLTISGHGYLGFFGQLEAGAEVKNLGIMDVNINGVDDHIGGLAGYNRDGRISGSYSTGTVDGRSHIGGLVGENMGSIAASYSSTEVTGSFFGREFGGLTGTNKGSISMSYSTGSVTGGWYVGGLVGTNLGSIFNSYSTGTVGGKGHGPVTYDGGVGGLIGDNSDEAIIINSYSTGLVSEDGNNKPVGGLVGETHDPMSEASIGFIADSFWDIKTSGQNESYGGSGLPTTELQTARTYLDAGWDFVGETENGPNDVWKIVEGQTYPLLSWQKYGGGTGESTDPYLIYTAEHLNALGAKPNDYDKHSKLMADIDLSEYIYDRAVIAPDVNEVSWEFDGSAFAGIFNGNGHTISHLAVTGRGPVGLFGVVDKGASISNLSLEAIDVNGLGFCVGGLAGSNSGSITASSSTGHVTGKGLFVGGLVGANSGSITASHSAGFVESTAAYGIITTSSVPKVDVGGLVGSNGGCIIASYSTSGVEGRDGIGGLAGYNSVDGSITACFSTGGVSGDSQVGGLVGCNNGNVAMSYTTGMVTGNSDTGGLIGRNSVHSFGTSVTRYGVIASSFWDIETSGQAISDGGTGLSSAEMQDIDTYFDTGWDLVNEIDNGICDYWQISSSEYPRLYYESGENLQIVEGSGTVENPYLIQDKRDLSAIWFKPLAYYRMESPIDLSGSEWSTAIVPWFGGNFDGNGHIISNLCIRGHGYIGLFGCIGSDASVSDLTLEATNINITGGSVGALAGRNSGSIRECYVSGTIRNSMTGDLLRWSVGSGGLVGFNAGSISACQSNCSVFGGSYNAGGLTGWNDHGSQILSCYSTGAVIGKNCVGGLVGSNGYRAAVRQCYTLGSVTGNRTVGGLVGYNESNSIISCFWDVETCEVLTSHGGTGLTTSEMQTASTFLEAGWDFIDETDNGTEDIWWIDEGQDYPRLWWELQ